MKSKAAVVVARATASSMISDKKVSVNEESMILRISAAAGAAAAGKVQRVQLMLGKARGFGQPDAATRIIPVARFHEK